MKSLSRVMIYAAKIINYLNDKIFIHLINIHILITKMKVNMKKLSKNYTAHYLIRNYINYII